MISVTLQLGKRLKLIYKMPSASNHFLAKFLFSYEQTFKKFFAVAFAEVEHVAQLSDIKENLIPEVKKQTCWYKIFLNIKICFETIFAHSNNRCCFCNTR